jgi:hypothetical protein
MMSLLTHNQNPRRRHRRRTREGPEYKNDDNKNDDGKQNTTLNHLTKNKNGALS